jgi:hypothetical protein
MKKYFTKYLPIGGEIKQGDHTVKDGVIFFHHRVSTTEMFEGHQKVQLFLCSRDIQEGDKVRYGDNCTAPEHEVEGSCETNGCWKVIGEVSPAAVWVTEGMEFDANPGMYTGEWQALPIYKGDTQVTFLGSRKALQARHIDIPVEKYIILFKCPNCKTFH